MSEKVRLNRAQLSDFLNGDEDAIRVFEKLLKGYNELLDREWPVGSTYIQYDAAATFPASESPEELFLGTWEIETTSGTQRIWKRTE